MAVLLTGANGNLGKELTKQASFDFVKFVRGDCLEEKFSSGIEVVIHAASDLHTQAAESPKRLIDSNLFLTSKILEMAGKFSVPRFVYISSCSVYGKNFSTNELSQCNPLSLNGMVKLLNEKIIEDYCLAHGIKYEILRVFNLYGGHDQFSILHYMKKSLESNRPFILNNNGVAQRDFIHVSDVAGIILYILKNGMTYTHLNLGTGSATKVSFLVDWLKHRFPHFKFSHRFLDELEYSRADVSRLSSFIDWDFVRIEDYLSDFFLLEKS